MFLLQGTEPLQPEQNEKKVTIGVERLLIFESRLLCDESQVEVD